MLAEASISYTLKQRTYPDGLEQGHFAAGADLPRASCTGFRVGYAKWLCWTS